MRIITGRLKGRVIPVPDTGSLRPTSDRTKEGLFSVIAARRFFDGTRVLDLFAGSGNLGFEAISRGSEHVLFVDQHPEHIRHIEKLAHQFNIKRQVQTRTQSVEQFLDGPSTAHDFIFCDPPYDYFMMTKMTDKILHGGWLKPDGWFILEHDKRHDFSSHAHCFYARAYGRTIVSIFQAQAVDSDEQ